MHAKDNVQASRLEKNALERESEGGVEQGCKLGASYLASRGLYLVAEALSCQKGAVMAATGITRPHRLNLSRS